VHAYEHDTADSWLLKDVIEDNKVMEYGNEFHTAVVLDARDFSKKFEQSSQDARKPIAFPVQ